MIFNFLPVHQVQLLVKNKKYSNCIHYICKQFHYETSTNNVSEFVEFARGVQKILHL